MFDWHDDLLTELGGHWILNLRGLVQSERFDRGWELIASCYKAGAESY